MIKLLRKLDDKVTGMGIRKIRAYACLYWCALTLISIQLSRMGVLLTDYLIVAFGAIAIFTFCLFVNTPKGMPTRNNINT